MIELFSFRGRTGRLGYWRVQLLSVVLIAIVVTAGYAAMICIGRVGGVLMLGLAPVLPLLVATMLRRLHDRGKGVGWLLLFQLCPPLASGAGQDLMIEDALGMRLVGALLSLAGFGLALWGFVEVGFLRGDPGDNRFGAAPAR